jgi:dTDP-4-dehydrorhamnose reductase
MRVLIIGGDSVVGAAFARALTRRGETVYATTRRRDTVGGKRLYLDLAGDEIETVALPSVDISFFCAGVSGFASCRNDPVKARRVNVDGTARLARRLTQQGVYSVLLSSTAVFDFQTPHVTAEAPVRPLTVLGQVKAQAEVVFLGLGPLGSILRLTKVVVPESPLFSQWIGALHRSEEIVAYSDIHIAPISLEDATEAMFAVATDRGRGVYQISAVNDISYFDFAHHLAKLMRVSSDLVRSQRAMENGIPSAEIPRFTTLESSRIEALTGRPAPDPYKVVETVFESQIARLGVIESPSGPR